jgi:hypothetical protein
VNVELTDKEIEKIKLLILFDSTAFNLGQKKLVNPD